MTDLITIADKLLLDTKEVKALLSMSEAAIAKQVKAGNLRAVVPPGCTKRYYRPQDLEAFVESMDVFQPPPEDAS